MYLQSSHQEYIMMFFFFSSRRRHTRLQGDWSSDVCSSDLEAMDLVHHGVRIGEEAVQLLSAPQCPSGVMTIILDGQQRSEEHTSELQSPCNLVCRLLLEKKK